MLFKLVYKGVADNTVKPSLLPAVIVRTFPAPGFPSGVLNSYLYAPSYSDPDASIVGTGKEPPKLSMVVYTPALLIAVIVTGLPEPTLDAVNGPKV